MNRGHKMRLKRNRAESLGCHDRHPLPRVCLREPGSRNTERNTIQGPVPRLMMFGHTMTSARAWGRSNDFLLRPYATPDWRWFWHANKIYGITAFMLNGWYWNMPVFLEDNFLILEHKVSFGFASYPSSVLIYENRPRENLHKSPRLSCQWSVA